MSIRKKIFFYLFTMVQQSNAFFLALLVLAIKVQLFQLVESDFPFIVVSGNGSYVLGCQSSKIEVQGSAGARAGSRHDGGDKRWMWTGWIVSVLGSS